MTLSLEFAIENCSKLSATSRALLQELQGDFNPTSTRPYFVFFQRINTGDFSKYATPKFISVSKRSSKIFKFTKLYKCLTLRYTCSQCCCCKQFFSLFNTSKPYKLWELDSMPSISRKLLKNKGIILCSDCLWLTHIEDSDNE